jgi:hypothetical protein
MSCAPGPLPLAIEVTARQQTLLEEIARSRSRPHAQVVRASIILRAAAGERNQAIARALDVYVEMVSTWRARWAAATPTLQALEGPDTAEALWRAAVEDTLADTPRSGRPATFSPEQIVQILAVACEPPADSGRPVTHWTPPELAAEVVRRGIVPRISPRTVGRFLKRRRPPTAPPPVLAQSSPRGRPGEL